MLSPSRAPRDSSAPRSLRICVIFLVFQLIPITSVFPRLRPLTQKGGFGAAEIDNNLGEAVSCRFRHPLNPASNSS